MNTIKRGKWSAVLAILATSGCGPSAYERTVSVVNVEADRWDGGETFAPAVVDAYGRPLIASVETGPVTNTLELRSVGRDGLPQNRDDIVATRTRRHGRSTYTAEAAKAAGKFTGQAAIGAAKEIKSSLGFGRRDN